jgi:uncharacterized protein (DUF2141 family)
MTRGRAGSVAIVLACLAWLGFPPPVRAESGQGQASVIVTFTGFRNDDGMLLAEIYNRSDGFPQHSERALAKASSPIHGGHAHIAFDNLRPGEYAVVAFHDENGNYELDKNWMGIPTEGIAVSNDAPHLMGPPKFEDARFPVPEGGRTLTLQMQYH